MNFNEIIFNHYFVFALLFQNFKNWNFHSLNLQFNIPFKILVKRCIQQVNKLTKQKKNWKPKMFVPRLNFIYYEKMRQNLFSTEIFFCYWFWFSLLLKFNTRSIFHLFYISKRYEAKKKNHCSISDDEIVMKNI